jgi:hypothetical protein
MATAFLYISKGKALHCYDKLTMLSQVEAVYNFSIRYDIYALDARFYS